jgi:hypothetical protein
MHDDQTTHDHHPSPAPPQVSVWFFVGATFLFAAPALFVPDAPAWIRFGLFGLGLVAIAVGIVHFAREVTHRRSQRPD